MGYGALSLWLVVFPERFGLPPLPTSELRSAAERASKELRRIFHAKPLKPWQARKGRSEAHIASVSSSRRRVVSPEDLSGE